MSEPFDFSYAAVVKRWSALRDWHGAQADKMPDREDHANARDRLNDYLAATEADQARTRR